MTGNFRSRSGCITCRKRRVKCDETHPICKACEKKDRPCEWEQPHARFKGYQPESSSTKLAMDNEGDGKAMVGISEGGGSQASSPRRDDRARESEHSPGSWLGIVSTRSDTAAIPLPPAALHGREGFATSRRLFAAAAPTVLTYQEALLVRYYTEALGRWLDCTDATRQFTLGVPEKVTLSPVLCHAVLSFAARQRRDTATAEAAYRRSIALLTERLDEERASHDESLLCAIAILRFYEQSIVPSHTRLDNEKQSAAYSAIIHAAQKHRFIDPSAPTLREAAFWVYVRQSLYYATIRQKPLVDVDFSLQLHPTPASTRESNSSARLRVETAWSNQILWLTARVVNFCFETEELHAEHDPRLQTWQTLCNLIQAWLDERPTEFNAFCEPDTNNTGVFREIWFTADWHVMAFAFYQFSCIMLLSYKPGPKFAIRNVETLSETDRQILEHARAMCGAIKGSPEVVPLSILLCHTISIWAPLVTESLEREEILQLLSKLEETHLWPTTWVISEVKRQWGMN